MNPLRASLGSIGSLAAALALLAAPATAQSYTGPSSIAAGNSPSAIVAADLDADGDEDLVVCDAAFSTATVYENVNGTIQTSAVLSIVNNPVDLAAFDADGDGDLDLAFVGGNSSQLSVHLNDGAGNFGAGSFSSAGFAPLRMLPIDGDGDGDLDLLVSNNIVNAVSLLTNDGSGGFSFTGATTNIPGPAGLAKGDLDGDGDDDVVVACTAADVILTIRNDGTALVPQTFVSVGSVPLDVVIGDFNHDQRPDVVTANVADGSISVLTNDRGFNFARADFSTPDTPVGLDITNSENSLGLDLVVACFDAWQVSVLTNDGQGAFNFSYTTYTGVNPLDVVSVDLDGDFNDDHVSVELSGSTVTTVVNQHASTLYPGTGEDIQGGTGIGGPFQSGPAHYRKEVRSGQFVEVGMQSPSQTFTNRPAVLVAQFFFPGFPPVSPAAGLHVNEFGFGAVLAIDSAALDMNGEVFQFTMPAGAEGLSLMFQAIALDAIAANGIYASGPGYELEIVP